MKHAGKTVLVTGAASGIGYELCRYFIEHGANVIGVDVEPVVLKDFEAFGSRVMMIQCDLSCHEKVGAVLLEKIRDLKIDVLINNASIVHNEPLISIKDGQLSTHDVGSWNRVISANLNAVMFVTSGIVKSMVQKRARGLIINIGSVCGAGNAGQSAYSATKAAVEALTVSWSKELGPFGIRVAGISPGYVETKKTLELVTQSKIKNIISITPKRRLGKITEIIDSVEFIVCNDFYNGRMLQIDGGFRI